MRKQNVICNIVISLTVMFTPAVAEAGAATSFAVPDTGYLSNDVGNIVEHNGGVWFATGEGVNFSFDDGETWLFYDNSNGLVSNSVTAIFSIATADGNRIWVATRHWEEIGEDLYPLSDGVSFSDDNGDQWERINFGPDGLDIPYVWGGDRTIFDITGHYDVADPADDWLFFTAFAGGFLASRDGGTNWRRVYPSAADSAQFNTEGVAPSYRNRYFSCAADTSHGDSLFVWAGTVGGFFQYVYATPREKPFSEYISSVAFCSTCPDEDSNFVYLAGDAGLTRGTKTAGSYISRFVSDGLPGASVISLADFGGRLFAGTINPSDSSSTGLAVSDDFGDTFTASTSFTESGLNKRILDFAVIRDRLYMAAEEAGLWVSDDAGLSWNQVIVDIPDLASGNRRNVVHALNAWDDTLRVGTDSGLVNLYLDPTGGIVSSQFYVFEETDTTSTKVVRIGTHTYAGADVIWTANRPLDIGAPMVGRSDDGGQNFTFLQSNVIAHDIAFFGDTAFVVGEEGIRFSPDGSNPGSNDEWIVRIREIVGGTVVDSLIGDTITVMEVLGDTVFIGAGRGFAVSFDRGESYDIRRPNIDTLATDVVLHYNSGIPGIAGEWIPALEVQYLPDTLARVWISNRPTDSGGTFGVSVGRIDEAIRDILDTLGNVVGADTAYIYNWDMVYDWFAWNFAFNGDTAFVATDGGLIYAEGDSLLAGILEWDTLQLVDSLGFPLTFERTSVFSAEVIGDFLWIGTDDRTVRVRLDDFGDQQPYFVIDSTDEVYAFPVPFSHTLDHAVEFHFMVEEDANLTLEIYDFSMNLVRRVIDDQFYAAGFYPTAGVGRRTWDGLNGKGDKVAVGVYYFKIEYSTGETRWGKLAVIP